MFQRSFKLYDVPVFNFGQPILRETNKWKNWIGKIPNLKVAKATIIYYIVESLMNYEGCTERK